VAKLEVLIGELLSVDGLATSALQMIIISIGARCLGLLTIVLYLRYHG
jgi:hypothetical protein